MKNTQEIRFAFIEAMIIQYGAVNRGHITRAFDIKEATGTRLFRAYKELCPKNLVMNQSSKMYEPGTNFDACYLEIDADRFLEAAQLMSPHEIVKFRMA